MPLSALRSLPLSAKSGSVDGRVPAARECLAWVKGEEGQPADEGEAVADG
jgi:hypothetical protein